MVIKVARVSNTATNLRQKRSAFPGFSSRGGVDAVEDGVCVSIKLTSFHEGNIFGRRTSKVAAFIKALIKRIDFLFHL